MKFNVGSFTRYIRITFNTGPKKRAYSSSSTGSPLNVCIVGSGPSGFYTADKVLKRFENANVDIIERLPTPFGLVRSGVAPDHPETKVVINQFSRICANERCSFFGNVSLGKDVHLGDLRQLYHVVVLAYGAENDRKLEIPGESLAGIISAREFVWWYNGHPDCSNLTIDLQSTDTAVVLGQGNVALDVARILLRPTSELAATDIAEHAISALQKSCIRKVYLVGRRGPVQAACTAKELREILGIKGLSVVINEADLATSALDEEEMKKNRSKKRVYELFRKAAESDKSTRNSASERTLYFKFYRQPVKFLPFPTEDKVAGLLLEKTVLKGEISNGYQYASGTGEFEEIECGCPVAAVLPRLLRSELSSRDAVDHSLLSVTRRQVANLATVISLSNKPRLVLKSIGYKSLPVDDIPFDINKGLVPNSNGRVLGSPVDSGLAEYVKGLYVVGWLKRGPTGIIGTNLFCAEETVDSIAEDMKSGTINTSQNSSLGRSGLLELLQRKGIRFISFNDWKNIDRTETEIGIKKGKPREKIASWQELIKAAV